MARQMVEVYAEFATGAAAMPVIVGRKSRIEAFAGADVTFTIEAMMGDRRALQACKPWKHALLDRAQPGGTRVQREQGAPHAAAHASGAWLSRWQE